LAEKRAIEAVAVHSIVTVLALLGVPIEEHVVEQELGGEHCQLLLCTHRSGLIELDRVEIRIGTELCDESSCIVRSLLGDKSEVTSSLRGGWLRDREFEVETKFRPAAKATRTLHLGERFVGVGVGTTVEFQSRDEHPAKVGLNHATDEVIDPGGGRGLVAALLILSRLVDASSIQVDTVLAAGEADKCR
jgi:hypothetical protein